MKKLKISLEADLPKEVVEGLYEELHLNSDVELAAFLKGVYANALLADNSMHVNYIDVRVEDENFGCGGILN